MRSFVKAHDIFAPGPVVVACSGGPDSLALLGILHALSRELGLVLHVAHFDHRMRPSSSRDARLVQRVATSLGLPSHIGSAPKAPRGEAEARDARYRFLRGVARETGAHAIALGHTRDDQAETVLLHLVRGSGVVGLAAMRPRREDLARPLLCLSRAETLAFVAAMGVRAARDPSNASERYARNLVRLRVMPRLRRINPRADEALARLADNAAALADILRGRAEDALHAATLASAADAVTIDLARLPEDDGARSEALALAAERITARTPSERHRRALLKLSREREGSARLDLPGGTVALREYARLRIGQRRAPTVPPAPIDLEEGRAAAWDGWTFLASRAPTGGYQLRGATDAAAVTVRAWRAGDRLVSGGKVQDVLVDAKIPRRLRDAYPVVVARSGDVVWVPGVATRQPTASDGALLLFAKPPTRAEA